MAEAKLIGGQDSSQGCNKRADLPRSIPAIPGQSAAVQARVLLNFEQLRKKLNVSERTARKIVAEPWMCDPIELGPRALRWVEIEVDEAIASRAPRRPDPLPEPEQLTRGKMAKASGATTGTAAKVGALLSKPAHA